MAKKKSKSNKVEAIKVDLDRFSTTIKAASPTVYLGGQSQYAHAYSDENGQGRVPTFKNGAAVVGHPMHGKNGSSRKLRKMARRVAKRQSLKPKRSKLPLVVLVLCGLLGYGSYFVVKSLQPYAANVENIFDYNKWLDQVSTGDSKSEVMTPVKQKVNQQKKTKSKASSRKSTATKKKTTKKLKKVQNQSTSKKKAISSKTKKRAGKVVSSTKKAKPNELQRKKWRKTIKKVTKKSQKDYKRHSKTYRSKKGAS